MQTEALPRFPYNFARQYGVCIEYSGEENPSLIYKSGVQPHIFAEARRFAGRKLECHEVSSEQFEQVLASAYQHDSGSAQRFADDAGESLSLESAASHIADTSDLLAQEDDAPVIRLINAMLMEAMREKASDIHIETFEKSLAVRFRVDGILQETLKLQPALAPLLVSRIKVMAKLDIAEKRMPQDGRITLRIGKQEVDVRVSTIPTGTGERVVLRLLDKHTGSIGLESLGIAEAGINIITGMIRKPHGIILLTGPTGSGKSTTLYAMLSKLNDRSRNIMTVEDPIEYQIEGIGQTQVNSKIDMTFARGLRAILRQDPDIVMIGEIRDAETARIAVQASITGHLVLSTLHTNTAIGAVTRLVDMGVEPFMLSSSLIGLMAQRLVRSLCMHCRQGHNATQEECGFLGCTDRQVIYHATGCKACNHTGYKGRIGIYEIVPVDENMRVLIHNGASEHDLNAYARKSAPSINDDGRDKVLQGITTISEVMRVANE